MGNNHKGFSLAELLTAVALMAIIAGISSLGLSAVKHTPRREAEKIAAYLVKLTEKADMIRADFTAKISGNSISVTWKDKSGTNKGSENFSINSDFTYAAHFDTSNIKDTSKAWDYESTGNFLISALPSLQGSYTLTGGGTDNYDFEREGNRYISITPSEGAAYYVVITAKDVAE